MNTRFSCAESSDGPGLASCDDSTTARTLRGGQGRLDTSTPGSHTYTVTALSRDGQRAVAAVRYTVVLPSNRFRVRHLNVHRNGTVAFDLTVPGRRRARCAGDHLEALAAARHACDAVAPRNAPLRVRPPPPGPPPAGTRHVKITPSGRGRRQVRHHHRPVRINLWVSYRPAGGTPANAAFINLLVTK